ncbi:polysaccharide deacetylase family protein [Sinorhizobium fredii]|uniref:polysaccharide deacetylase family protein n=1 Tax=Rhizobium fredii TaxID=380 RepID=UPI0030B119ED
MRRLTLTFDNGPCPGATERILDILAQRKIHATFFVVGDRMADPAAKRSAERAWEEGHWIGNHTMTHGEPLGLTSDPKHCEKEIGAAQATLGQLAHPDRLFRPHGKGSIGPHLLSRKAVRYLSEHRYSVITWNNAPGDWVAPHDHWVEPALSTIAVQDWSLLVLHDFALSNVMDSLPRFLDKAAERDVEITQAFPEDCIVMWHGEARPAIERCAMAGRKRSEPT